MSFRFIAQTHRIETNKMVVQHNTANKNREYEHQQLNSNNIKNRKDNEYTLPLSNSLGSVYKGRQSE